MLLFCGSQNNPQEQFLQGAMLPGHEAVLGWQSVLGDLKGVGLILKGMELDYQGPSLAQVPSRARRVDLAVGLPGHRSWRWNVCVSPKFICKAETPR